MISFRFITTESDRDDAVAKEMRRTERNFLRAGDERTRNLCQSRYAELEAWFGGDTDRLNAAIARIQSR